MSDYYEQAIQQESMKTEVSVDVSLLLYTPEKQNLPNSQKINGSLVFLQDYLFDLSN